MDFIIGLPKTKGGYDAIWVIVDRLTKVAYFLPVKQTYDGNKLAELYLTRIVILHGVQKELSLIEEPNLHQDFGGVFMKLWVQSWDSAQHIIHKLGDRLRVNQILEDMLRTCVLVYGLVWEICLPFAQFSYNNSYQSSLGMAPFEALYGRKCRTPLNWTKTGEGQDS